MSKETRTSFDVQDDLRTDYALIATGVGAALVALVYLLLIWSEPQAPNRVAFWRASRYVCARYH
jgi:hypothetical protein